jgi:hypothetical protein
MYYEFMKHNTLKAVNINITNLNKSLLSSQLLKYYIHNEDNKLY